MKSFVEYIIKNLVDQPDEVCVECIEGERGVVVEVRVASEDVGKVVGKKGRTIEAVRTLSRLVSIRLGYPVRVNIIEDK